MFYKTIPAVMTLLGICTITFCCTENASKNVMEKPKTISVEDMCIAKYGSLKRSAEQNVLETINLIRKADYKALERRVDAKIEFLASEAESKKEFFRYIHDNRSDIAEEMSTLIEKMGCELDDRKYLCPPVMNRYHYNGKVMFFKLVDDSDCIWVLMEFVRGYND